MSAKKTAPVTPENPAPSRRSGAWRVAAIVAGCLVVGGTAFWYVRRDAPAPVPPVALPALPNLAGRPVVLQQRLAAANAAVAASATPATVAELGKLYHENGYFDEASACWSWLAREQPREGRWRYYLADLRRTKGDYDGLEMRLREVVQLAPTYAPAWLQLGQLQFKSGRFDEAQVSFDRRLALIPGDIHARLWLARLALQKEQQPEARRMLEQLVHDAPDFQPSRNLYAELLASAGEEEAATKERFAAAQTTRFREADDPWLEELQPYCYDPGRLAVLGTIDYQTNHGDRGRAYLERAMELAPGNLECAKALSSLYLKLGDFKTAQSFLGRTIPAVQPPDAILYVNLCEAYRLQQHSAAALPLVDAALQKLPQAFQLHNERGAILGDLGRLPEAAASYRDAVARAPTDTDSNFSLGTILLALGQRAEAITFIKRSLAVQPSFPKALIVLGKIELEAGNLEAAASYLKPLYELHQDQPMARQLMAQWYLRAGDAAAAHKDQVTAEQHYRAGFALDPNSPVLAVNLGTLLLLKGDPAAATAPLQTYHRLRPGDPQGCLFLGQAYAQTGRVPEARDLLRQGEQLARKAGNAETAGYCREILNQL